MRKLKLFFSMLMLIAFSVGNVWATEYEYQMVTAVSQVTEGTYVVGALRSTTATNNFYFGKASVSSGDWVVSDDYVTVAESGGVRKFDATSLPTGAVEFELTGNNTDGFTIKNGTKYLYYTAASNRKLAFAADGSSYKWTVSAKSSPLISGGVVLKKKAGLDGNYTISENSTAVGAIRGYANTTEYRAIYLFKKQEKAGTPTCATPTFSPVAGEVVSGTQVAISCSTDGATIHYTTDGTDPTASSPTYSSAITIDAAKTIKAIAVKTGLTNSAVASASYTIATPLTTIDQIFAAATAAGSTEVTKFITFNNWVVTAVKGNNAYVSDGTKGFVIYGSGHGFVVGNTLSGTVSCKVKLYNNYAQLGSLTSTTAGLTVGTGGSVTPVEIDDADDLNSYGGAYTGSVIKLTGTCTTANSKLYILGVQLWNNLFSYTNPTAGKDYHCTGVYYYGGTTYGHEIMPRNASDIEEVAEAGAPEAPEFTPTPDTYNEIKNVTITCETDEAVIYYTMTNDGTTPATPDPTNDNQVYNGAINLDANGTYKFKAIAFKNDLTSTEVSATYVIDLPLPSHDFTYNFDFTAIDGFNSWDQSYTEHTVGYDILPAEPDGVADVNVVFASANKQGTGQAIVDRPVTKGGDVELKLLPATKKYITAVKFACQQWTTKTQTITLHYSTDGGSTYSELDPSVTSTNFAIQSLDLPETTNAVKITFSSTSNQVGISSVHFDLVDKPVVKKTVTITAPAAVEGTLVVKNGEDPISDGDEIEVGTTLKIFASPEDGYSLSAISVKDQDNADVSVNSDNEFVVPDKNVTVSATFTKIVDPATLTLNVQGTESPYPGSHNVGDEIPLPTTATVCDGNVFVGWSEVLIATPGAKPTTKYYDKGAQYTLAEETQTLYAVYAQSSNATWQIASEDLEILDSETSSAYAKYAGDQSKSGITYNIADVMPATGDNTGKLQIKKSSGKLYNKTSFTADIESIVIDGYNIAVFAGEEVISSTPASGAITGTGTGPYTYQFPSGKRYFHIQNNTNNAAYPASITVNFQPEYSNYTTSCIVPVTVPDPEFDVAGGTYTEVKTVKIDNYDDDYIYVYTLDGSAPTADSNLDPEGTAEVYDDATGIVIDASCTLKARAYDIDGNYSDVTSVAYTINLPVVLSTIPAVFAKATEVGSTETEVTVVFDNWVVSGIGGTDNKNVYVTDGTNGLIIFGTSHGFTVKDKLSGSVTANLKLYNGAAELLAVKASDLTVTNDGVVIPVEKTIDQLSGVNTGAPIIVNNVKFDGTDLVDASNNKLQPYTTLYPAAVTSLTENKYYNITGIYTQFNAKKEILPRSADDIEELTQEAPTMTWYTSDAKTVIIAANATYSISIGDAFAPVFETNSSGDLTYSSSDETIAEINATTGELTLKGNAGETTIACAVAAAGNYTGGSQSFILKVLEGATVDYVVILAQYNGAWYAMKNTGVSSSKAAAIEVAYSDGKVWNLSTADQEAIKWKRTVDGEGNVTFQAPNNNYLQTSNNNLAMGAEECIWTWNETYYRTGSQTRTFLYRPSASGFKSNAVSNAGSNDYSALPVITTAVFADGEGFTEVRSGLEVNRYYTVCLPKKVTAIKGASFWTLNNKSQDGATAYLEEETNNLPFAAGKPFIIQATAENLEVVYEGDATEVAGTNGALHGTLVYMNAAALAAAGSDVYMLFSNELRPVGENNHLNANRAYVKVDELTPVSSVPQGAPGKRVIAMPMQKDEAQGFDNLESGDAPKKVMIDGTLYILRGEKVYDATGRLVK